MSLESVPQRGEKLAKAFIAEGDRRISLESSPAQVFLSQTAYPNLEPGHAIQKWAMEDAEAFRAYIDGRKERGEDMEVNINDSAELHAILAEMRGSETLH